MQTLLRNLHPKPSQLKIHARGGAKLEHLIHDPIRLIKSSHNPSQTHVYFMAGLCDITYRDIDPNHHDLIKYRTHMYEEVIFIEDHTETIARITNLIDNMSEEIKLMGAKPCFMTIPPCSLVNWNLHRLNNSRTTHLIHHQQYKDMQQNLIKAIKDINHFIFATNTSNNMATPKLADDIIRSAGTNKNPRVRYNRLADGTHATPETNQKWASKIINTIAENRTRHPSNQTQPIGTVITHHRSTPRITPRKPVLIATKQLQAMPPRHTSPSSRPTLCPLPFTDSSDSDSDLERKRPWRPS